MTRIATGSRGGIISEVVKSVKVVVKSVKVVVSDSVILFFNFIKNIEQKSETSN